MMTFLRRVKAGRRLVARLNLLVLGVLFGASLATRAQTASQAPDKFIVVLEGEPAAESFLKSKAVKSVPGQVVANAPAAAAKAQSARIAAQHDAFSAQLQALGATEAARYSKLLNAFSVKATEEQAKAIRSLPGVRSVHRCHLYEVNTASSVPFIGAPNVWGGITAADGTGIRIGIIDTGIDYTHADFGGSGVVSDYTSNDRTMIEPGTFPTTKVAGGYDFVGDAYNAASTNTATPAPDPDPMDCAGHGSHVAGIAAGFGVLPSGATFNGPYTNGMDFAQFKIGPGVAPRALLYALKVFGCSGSTDDSVLLQAVEWAADPNNDLNFTDRLDAVNLSIGSIFGLTGTNQPLHAALNTLADLGCVPVLSAGNSYDTFYIVGHPSTSEKALSVACSIDNGTTTPAVQVMSPSTIVTNLYALEGAITAPLAQTGPKQGALVYAQPTTACPSLSNGGSISGNIALIDRGGTSCSFANKILNAQNAGAIAVVVVNNVAGPPTVMGGSSSGITIPGVMISQSDGALLKAHLAEGVIVRLDASFLVGHPELTDRIADFSSRGPAAPNSVLKPEIAAPGFTITSVQVGGGTAAADMSGTSMAAPHVTGAAGLMRQLHPDWSVEDIKAALMNTARQTHDAGQNAYPESRTGAGRIQLDDAARAVVIAKAENSGGLVSLSFGALVLTNTYAASRNIVLTNHSAAAVTYSVTVSNTVSENGVTLTSLVTSVTVPAHGSVLAPVQFTANPLLFDRSPNLTTSNLINGSPRQFLYETSGEVWFQNTNLSIHLPYYANVRAGSAFQTGLTNLVLAIGSNALTANIPLSGFSTHPAPLVSAFQLGLLSTNQMLPVPESSTDLLAIGAASDALQQVQFNNTTVYFALATAGDWASPTPIQAEFRFQIDTNADGISDLAVYNNSLGNNGNYSDVFESSVGNFVYRFVNGFSAGERDTAPFNNSVLVLPMPVSVLGLSVGHSQFRYRAMTGDYFGLGETTPWVTFDAARPVLDATGFGISGKPFFAAGGSVSLKADPNAAAANGFASPSHVGLMLLHHFNTPGSRLEVLDIKFAPQLFAPQTQGNNLLLRWSSASNGAYSIQYATNLSQGFVFTAAAAISATPPLNTFSVANGPEATRFYRVKQD